MCHGEQYMVFGGSVGVLGVFGLAHNWVTSFISILGFLYKALYFLFISFLKLFLTPHT